MKTPRKGANHSFSKPCRLHERQRRAAFAYERLLERRPELHGKVVLMLACVAAASGMKIYEDTQRLIEETIGRINGRFSQIDWVPIRFSTRRIPYEEMVAWFSQADICWITPEGRSQSRGKEYAAPERT